MEKEESRQNAGIPQEGKGAKFHSKPGCKDEPVLVIFSVVTLTSFSCHRMQPAVVISVSQICGDWDQGRACDPSMDPYQEECRFCTGCDW